MADEGHDAKIVPSASTEVAAISSDQQVGTLPRYQEVDSEPTPIGDIGSRHGETNDRGYSWKSTKTIAVRYGVQRVNRHAFRQSARVLGVKFRKILSLASSAAALQHLKAVPVHPTLVRAAAWHGVRVIGPQYHVRKQA
jgi:hypothetical protein